MRNRISALLRRWAHRIERRRAEHRAGYTNASWSSKDLPPVTRRVMYQGANGSRFTLEGDGAGGRGVEFPPDRLESRGWN